MGIGMDESLQKEVATLKAMYREAVLAAADLAERLQRAHDELRAVVADRDSWKPLVPLSSGEVASPSPGVLEMSGSFDYAAFERGSGQVPVQEDQAPAGDPVAWTAWNQGVRILVARRPRRGEDLADLYWAPLYATPVNPLPAERDGAGREIGVRIGHTLYPVSVVRGIERAPGVGLPHP